MGPPRGAMREAWAEEPLSVARGGGQGRARRPYVAGPPSLGEVSSRKSWRSGCHPGHCAESRLSNASSRETPWSARLPRDLRSEKLSSAPTSAVPDKEFKHGPSVSGLSVSAHSKTSICDCDDGVPAAGRPQQQWTKALMNQTTMSLRDSSPELFLSTEYRSMTDGAAHSPLESRMTLVGTSRTQRGAKQLQPLSDIGEEPRRPEPPRGKRRVTKGSRGDTGFDMVVFGRELDNQDTMAFASGDYTGCLDGDPLAFGKAGGPAGLPSSSAGRPQGVATSEAMRRQRTRRRKNDFMARLRESCGDWRHRPLLAPETLAWR